MNSTSDIELSNAIPIVTESPKVQSGAPRVVGLKQADAHCKPCDDRWRTIPGADPTKPGAFDHGSGGIIDVRCRKGLHTSRFLVRDLFPEST
ncbi:MAG TPA: hypothetical protein VHL58_13870 [Thermoanaerobaculia bacterium]|nr:hypothetical protein [Thermoanaerobaculia bacterium]